MNIIFLDNRTDKVQEGKIGAYYSKTSNKLTDFKIKTTVEDVEFELEFTDKYSGFIHKHVPMNSGITRCDVRNIRLTRPIDISNIELIARTLLGVIARYDSLVVGAVNVHDQQE